MKKIINKPENYTDDMLHGIYQAHPDMVKYVENDLRCYCTAKKKEGKVAIITGGGPSTVPWICRREHAGWMRCRLGLSVSLC